MLPVWNYYVLLVTEDCLGFIEGDLVLLQVCGCLWRVPLEFKIFEDFLVHVVLF